MIHLHSIAAAAALTAFRHRNSADDLSTSRTLFSGRAILFVRGNPCSSSQCLCAETISPVMIIGGSYSRAGFALPYAVRPPPRRASHARYGGGGRLWMLDEKRSLSQWQRGR